MRDFLEKIKTVSQKISEFLSPATKIYKKYSDILKPVAVLTSICVIIGAALALTNALTSKKIADINLQTRNREMAALMPAETYNQPEISFPNLETDSNFSFFIAKNGQDNIGYIITCSAKGYGGDVVVMTAINKNNSIAGISVIGAEDETPGLGQNAKKPEFSSQFIGMSENITVVKNGANTAKNEINAITGATVSSKAVATAVNNAFSALGQYQTLNSTAEVE